MLQNDDTSSMPNNSPPTGAVNADATPAAAPAAVKLRLHKISITLIDVAIVYMTLLHASCGLFVNLINIHFCDVQRALMVMQLALYVPLRMRA